MGLALSIYKISTNQLPVLKNLFPNFTPYEISSESVTFEKTFDAIHLILTKNQSAETRALIQEIFTPTTSFGSPDWEAEIYPVFYLSIDKITKINNFLKNVHPQNIVQDFDFSTLNGLSIYPTWDWEKVSKTLFIEEIKRLKTFFQTCHAEKNLMLIYIG